MGPKLAAYTAAEAKNVLSRSNLGDAALAQIWDLANVTQTPQLTFPEFALAMYLTSMKMTGRDIPQVLPEAISNEIKNAVRMIQSGGKIASQATGIVPAIQQPSATGFQPRSYSSSMLNTMSGGHPLQAQMTGYQQPMTTGLQVPMMTGATTFSGPNVPMPTGMHGNNLDFANRMMPQSSASFQPTTQFQSMSSKVKIPWAVTTEEKKRYKKIFDAWDSDKKGFLTGEKAKEIFTQSGLSQNVLMQIWNLSDPNNQGKLNVNEFSVAMHLIYRKLNGYDVPTTLPPELIPPSTRELKESVSALKQSILEGIAQKKSISSFSESSPSLLSPPTRVTQRARSVSPSRHAKKDVEDRDTDVGYVSSARRMGPDRSRWGQARDDSVSPSPSRSATTSSYAYRGKATRISDLRKQIGEYKERLATIEYESTHRKPKGFSELSYTEQKDIKDLKDKIKELQKEISNSTSGDANRLWDEYIQKTYELSNLAEQEKSLESEIQYLLDNTVRELIRQLKETEDDLAEKKVQLVKAKAAKATNPSAPTLEIVGTGPNGEITESDRIRAKAKAMVAARMGKITGKTSTVDVSAECRKIDEERADFKDYADTVEKSLRDIEDNVNSIHMEISLIGLDIRKHENDLKKIEERNRFEHGTAVGEDLKTFIQELSFETAVAQAPDADPTFEDRFPEF
ncbi:actin organization and endocytosis protein [Apophysomyces ossiformis]|uniref:Actin organization and endocytosis protein n=1 Tax=Apophysomyces ossiformis TaxID=679940 RepID=A0A8H7C0H8_9FUNG|nr:actin organization and endocytosis protein [Apophysomyces ossiformis]